MKHASIATIFVGLTLSLPLFAQFPTIDVGSDGSYGEINITTDTTLDMPEDGIFQATTVTVAEGATLKFNPNAANTAIHIIATGEVVVAGTIDIRGENGDTFGGKGGPGGFDGGAGRTDGSGPGGGKVRTEGVGFGPNQGQRANNYASRLLIPLVGGSGGGGLIAGVDGRRNDGTGGGGGGAILLASNTKVTLSGKVDARGGGGGRGQFGGLDSGGSGGTGAMRLVAPVVEVTSGQEDVGNLRVRIDAFEYLQSVQPSQIIDRGSNFVIFPEPNPQLEILELGGEQIDGNSSVALVQLPAGADPNVKVKVRASNFGRSVPIAIVLQPERGERTIIETTIDNSTEDPVEQEYDITLPVNLSTQVFVWTR